VVTRFIVAVKSEFVKREKKLSAVSYELSAHKVPTAIRCQRSASSLLTADS
jgi:hypothetical protein